MSEGSVERDAAPRLKRVNRQQLLLRTVDVEKLISADHSARAIWEFVGRLNLDEFRDQVKSVEGSAGRPALDPQLLVSLWVYSYSRGVSSARAIERLCEHDPAYQWLTGLDSVSAHTLSSFRVDHPAALRDLFGKVLGLLSLEGLISLERVMQDGTRVKACASSSGFRTKARVEEHLKAARETVESLDRLTEEESNLRVRRARERSVREREQRLTSALEQFRDLETNKSRVDRVSTTDPEARVMKQADGGSAPSYNVQISTDAAHSVIVGIDVTQSGADYGQLIPAINRLEEQGRRPKQLVVDGGYISSENIVAMAERGVDLVGPEPRSKAAETNRQKSYRQRRVHQDYESTCFRYDESTLTYVCPQGKRLKYDAKYESYGMVRYRYKASAAECAACPVKDLCCPRNRRGRSIERIEPIVAVAAYRAKVVTDAARAIYRTRSQVAEFPNLWLKTKHGLRQFRVRGKTKVLTEATGPHSPTTSSNGFDSAGTLSFEPPETDPSPG
jgi:transposase